MLFTRKDKQRDPHGCPKCGASVTPGARFCVKCGEVLQVACRACGKLVAAGARFCSHCGEPLQSQQAAGKPLTDGNRWARQPGEFARRVESSDMEAGWLERLFRRGVTIEEGTRGILLESGRMCGMLEPGFHNVDSVIARLPSLNFRAPCSVILVDTADVELQLRSTGLRTADHQTTDAVFRLVVGLDQPLQFATNVLRGRTTVRTDEIAQSLEQETTGVLQSIVATCKLDELYGNRELVERLEDELRTALQRTLQRYGLAFVALQFVSFEGDTFDEIRRRRQELGQQQAKADVQQQRNEVDRQRRDLVYDDWKHRQSAQQDYLEHGKQLEHEAQLRDVAREQELQDVASMARQRQADRTLQEVPHQIQATQAQQQLDAVRRQGQHQALDEEQEAELRRQQRELEAHIQGRRLKDDYEDDRDLKLARQGIDIKRMYDEQKLATQRAQQQLEQERLQMLSQASIEALIAAADSPAKAQILAELKRTEALRGCTEEQILAMAAGNSPEVARAFAEKFRAAAAGENQQQMRAMYERMLQVQQDATGQLAAAQQQALQQMMQLMQTALHTQSQTVASATRQQGPAVVFPPPGSGAATVIGPQPAPAAHAVHAAHCPQCRTPLAAGDAFCGNCGYRVA